MAFNPFHKFRKHQKVIFAFITIFCMLSFVACSGLQGGGDLAHWLQGFFMGGSGPRDEVGQLYGSGVGQRDLAMLARQRELANIFMASATEAALQNKMQELRPPGDARMTPDMFQRIFRDPDVMFLQQRLNNQPYFGGSLKSEGLFDFKIWLHQADKLGIKLSPEEIQREVNRLTMGKFTKKESGAIEAGLRQRFRDYTPEMLSAALGNELRVSLAQSALLGLEPSTNSRMPVPATPEEFWEFYKDSQTKVDVRLVGIKVEDFLSQVKDTPKEAELQELYKKFKDKEYSPDSKDPGFKTPRRIQVEWVGASSTSDQYKQAAKDFRMAEQTTRQVGAGAGVSLSGLGGVLDAAIAGTVDSRLIKEYDDTKWRNYQAASYAQNWRWSPYPMHEESVNQPGNAASAVGAAAGELAGISGLSAFIGNATMNEMEARVRRGTTWVLSGSKPTPLMAAAIGTYLTPRSEYIPLAVVQEKVNERLNNYLAQDLVAVHLKAVQKEVDAMAKADEKGKAERAAAIAKLIKEYNLKSGKTTGPRDAFKNKIGDDPGLAQLKEAYMRPPSLDREGKRFANMFFTEKTAPYASERFPQSQFRAADDETEWKSAPESFVFWKTEDKAARVQPFEDAEVRKEVEHAWRFNKARELAKKEAEALAIKLREDKGDVRRLRDSAEKLKKELIELPSLTRKAQEPSFRPEVAFMWNQPRVPDDKVPNAGPEFATKVLALQDKEKGDTLVTPDQPEANYYVAVLVDKKAPNVADFVQVYQNASPNAIRRDPLLMMFEQERMVKYFQDAMALLREEAKLKIDKDKLKGTDNFGGSESE